ncbi:hypothetical protein SYNPS1DRAFT_21289 [Syncephalis pseudoplumigaleata]|uniref:Uncharacterized protein n=1 Tax=Syncephalis pseudoplumigaleata TaxID=1712513 RepID=A0A4P9Z3G5_9FUNG|nr:hypothetical protein SYNPS1DRAFT_21289 [Syncephalis pseudoplumigaleata]|eukprot:RKP27097.1 hypothetical protein SYNPS1DRAFT_21289 [Syncephalis pseudoplumigaleata]
MPAEDTQGDEEVTPKTPRKPRKNNEVYWLASPPAVALKRMTDARAAGESSGVNVTQVVDWIRSKRALPDNDGQEASSTSDTAVEATSGTSDPSSWERLTLSSPASSSSPQQQPHGGEVKRVRHYSPIGVEKMLNLIDKDSEPAASPNATATESPTDPPSIGEEATAVQTEPSSLLRTSSLADSDLHEIEDIMSAVNEDLLDDVLVSEDSNGETSEHTDTAATLLDNIDFSQWSDEEGGAHAEDGRSIEEAAAQHKGR